MLILEWRATPRRLALQWRGGGVATGIAAQPANPAQLAAIIGPPGPPGPPAPLPDIITGGFF